MSSTMLDDYERRRVESERQRELQDARDEAQKWKEIAGKIPTKQDLDELEDWISSIDGDLSSLRDKVKEMKRNMK